MSLNQVQEILSSDDEFEAVDRSNTRGIDVIDLTKPVIVRGTVDLTGESLLTEIPPLAPDTGPFTRQQQRRRAAEDNIAISDNELDDIDMDDDEFPQILPDFASPPKETPSKSTSKTTVAISCPICFDSYEEIMKSGRQLISTKCGHVFCSICIKDSLQTAKVCPKCRKKVTASQLHPLYL